MGSGKLSTNSSFFARYIPGFSDVSGSLAWIYRSNNGLTIEAIMGSCLLGFLWLFLSNWPILPKQGCPLYIGSYRWWGHVYSWDGFFWSIDFHGGTQINQDLCSCVSILDLLHARAHLRNMEEVCVLSVALIRYRSARKYPFSFSIMIGADGRARTGIIFRLEVGRLSSINKLIYIYIYSILYYIGFGFRLWPGRSVEIKIGLFGIG